MLHGFGNWISSLVGKKEAESEEVRARNAKRAEGIGLFMEGHDYFLARREAEALERFDRAIDCGFENDELFEERATCLQMADYHVEAIEDFGKAIAGRPQDCNLYFMRSVSLAALCRHAEAANDLNEAIRLSKIENPRNAAYHAGAIQMGHPNATSIYEWHLAMLITDEAVIEMMRARLKVKRRERT